MFTSSRPEVHASGKTSLKMYPIRSEAKTSSGFDGSCGGNSFAAAA